MAEGMTRREWLVRVIGGVAAAAVAPLIDMADPTPAFWNQPAIRALKPWRIAFPDGTVFAFDAHVVAEQVLADDTVRFTLRPTGAPEITQERPMALVPAPPASRPILQSAGPTILHREDGVSMELQEITPPQLTHHEYDACWEDGTGAAHAMPGLRSMGTMDLIVRFT